MKLSIPANTLILVTGATGFTGSWLVKKLIQAGIRVRAIRRPTSKTEALSAFPIE
jgi:uncharacterized protein YbjT (DUF2867 family)